MKGSGTGLDVFQSTRWSGAKQRSRDHVALSTQGGGDVSWDE